MGVIKSAYEIALERSRGVEADKESLEANRYMTEGKKIVSKILDEGETDFNIKEALKQYEKKQLSWVKEGMAQSLLANYSLPSDELSLKRNKKVGEAFYSVIKDSRRLGRILNELEHFFSEFLEERKRLKEAFDDQYAERLREKEAQISKQLGGPVKLDPASDPEYGALLRKNMMSIEERYRVVLARAKEEIQKMIDGN